MKVEDGIKVFYESEIYRNISSGAVRNLPLTLRIRAGTSGQQKGHEVLIAQRVPDTCRTDFSRRSVHGYGFALVLPGDSSVSTIEESPVVVEGLDDYQFLSLEEHGVQPALRPLPGFWNLIKRGELHDGGVYTDIMSMRRYVLERAYGKTVKENGVVLRNVGHLVGEKMFAVTLTTLFNGEIAKLEKKLLEERVEDIENGPL